MASRLFTRQWCGTQLNWWLLLDEFDSSKVDVVFQGDESFSPLTAGDSPLQQQLKQQLKRWHSSTSSNFDSLIQVLLQLYLQHNKERVAATVHDERIVFELSMLDELGCDEVLLTGNGSSSSPLHVWFTLSVPVDRSPAEQLITCVEQKRQQQQQQQQQQQLLGPHSGKHDQQQLSLVVCFAASDSSSSSHIPVLQLKAPHWFTTQLPFMTLPAWEPHTSLLEYVPHLAERVTKHLSDHCPTALNRFQLLEGLSRLLGPALEANMQPQRNSTAAGYMTSSSSSLALQPPAAAVASVGSRAATGSAAAVWQVLFDQQPLLLYVELPTSFPSDGPLLSLQFLRRSGGDRRVMLQGPPWSPRWPVEEQVARLFNFIKLQAATAAAAAVGAAELGSAAAGGLQGAAAGVP